MMFLGHYKIVDLLIKNAADIEVKNSEGETPLILASKQGENWIEYSEFDNF